MPELTIQQRIQNMLDEIPDHEHDDHRREFSMSRPTARWMANMMLMIVESSGCNNGFTPEEAQSMKAVAADRKKLVALIGAGVVAVLCYFGNMVLHVMDGAFWKSLFVRLFDAGK